MRRRRTPAPVWSQLIAFVMLLVASIAAPPVLGQVAPPAGSGSVLPTPEQLRNPVPSAPPAQAAPRVRIRDEVERAPCLLDSPENAGLRIRVTHAAFANLGPVDEAQIASAYQPYIGSDEPISAICRIRDAVATRLRALGYIASVEVPVQRIVDGNVQFRVLYARVTQVRVIGQVGRGAKLFTAMLQRLIDGREFNRFRAERIVLLARDVPGYEVQLTLKPANTGAGDLIAEVRLAVTPLVVSANLSNLAAPTTGRFGAQLRADFNGLLGVGDQTSISVYSTLHVHEQQIYQFGEQALLGASGLRLAGHATYAVTRPALNLGAPIDAHTLLLNGELSYPVRRSQGLSLHAAAGLDFVDQNVDFDHAGFSRDRLRIGYVRLDGEAVDLRGIGPAGSIGWHVAGSLELRHGFDILGAQRDCGNDLARCAVPGYVAPSVPISDAEATVARGSVQVEVHPLRDILFSLDARGQVSSAPVASFEQFNLGNYTIGRGYAPGVLVGDNGAAARLEIKSRDLPLWRRFGTTIQPYAFVDAGWTWRHRSALPEPEHLVSAGGGLRAQIPGLAAIDLSGAVPLQTIPGATRRGDPLVLLTFSTNILPWRL